MSMLELLVRCHGYDIAPQHTGRVIVQLLVEINMAHSPQNHTAHIQLHPFYRLPTTEIFQLASNYGFVVCTNYKCSL